MRKFHMSYAGGAIAVGFLIAVLLQDKTSVDKQRVSEMPIGVETTLPDPLKGMQTLEVTSPAIATDQLMDTVVGFENPEERLAEYWAKLNAGDEIARFIDGAERMPRDDRNREAARLRNLIVSLEESGEVVSVQALYVQAAIINAQYEFNDSAREAEIALLKDDYRSRTPLPSTAHLGPQFQDYKTRERAIVNEVMAMDVYPRGLTRDVYLRERLDELRNEVYTEEYDD